MLDEAKAASGVQSLAVFAALCIVYSDEARREMGYRLNGPKREPVPEPKAEHGPAMSARECAHESGWRKGQRTGFSPRFFYDHAADLPFTIRHGRSLRFARPGFTRWLSAQKR